MKKSLIPLLLTIALTTDGLSQVANWKNFYFPEYINWVGGKGSTVYSCTNHLFGSFNRNTPNLVQYSDLRVMFHANFLRRFCVDKTGNVWVASDVGVLRYNGSTWTQFNTSNTIIPSDNIWCAHTDTTGKVWFGAGSSVVEFDGINWNLPAVQTTGLQVQDISTDSSGNVWVALTNGGISKYDGINTTNYGSGTSGNFISALYVDGLQNVWTVGNTGCSKFDGTNWTDMDGGLNAQSTEFITPGPNGEIYVGGWMGFAKRNTSSWTNYPATAAVYKIYVDSLNTKWVATSDFGLRKFTTSYQGNYTISNSGHVDRYPMIINVDPSGNKWIGAIDSPPNNLGLEKFDGSNWTLYSTGNSLNQNFEILDVATDLAGVKWFATSSNGLLKFDGQTWTHYYSGNSAIPCDFIYSIAVDQYNNKWLGTAWGLVKFDGSIFTLYDNSNSGLPPDAVTNVAIDHLGKKWAATSMNNTVKVTCYDDVNWTVYDLTDLSIPSNNNRSIAVDGLNNIWVGNDGGLHKYDGSNWTHWKTTNSGIPQNGVEEIAIDQQNKLWIALHDSGLVAFDGITWTRYTTANSGIASNFVDCLSIDQGGNKWIATQGSGISVFNENGLTASLNLPGITNFTASGFAKGVVFDDANGNKLQDNGENGIANQLLTLQPSGYIGLTDVNGAFTVPLPNGIFTMSLQPATTFSLTSDSATYHFLINNDTVQGLNFGLAPLYNKDSIRLDLTNGWASCNTNVQYECNFYNEGTNYLSGVLRITLDTAVSFISSYPAPDSIIVDSIYWTISSLSPFDFGSIALQLLMPDYTHIGDTLHQAIDFVSTVSSYTATNDVFQLFGCAYDPNEKSVQPIGGWCKGDSSLISNQLEYTIRFQNTGTDTAHNVRVEDVISPLLDLSTFQVLAASDPLSTTIIGRQVNFNFFDIMLPDSGHSEIASHGFVKFRISPVTSLSNNTVINNTAGIYFDQNPPVITNTTKTYILLSAPVSVDEIYFSRSYGISIYPNPVENNATVFLDHATSAGTTAELYSLQGAKLLTLPLQDGTKSFQLQKGNIASGTYYLRVGNSPNGRVGRLVVFN